jgi:D-aspartate ligase
MATEFLRRADLLDRLERESFDRPPAIICNAHITGLGVARALASHDVPVIAIDRNGDGVGESPEGDAGAGGG